MVVAPFEGRRGRLERAREEVEEGCKGMAGVGWLGSGLGDEGECGYLGKGCLAG